MILINRGMGSSGLLFRKVSMIFGGFWKGKLKGRMINRGRGPALDNKASASELTQEIDP